MFCDRDKADIAKSQIGFIKNIVFPIFDSLNLCLGSDKVKESCVQQIDNNLLYWEFTYEPKRAMTIEIHPQRSRKKKALTVKDNSSKILNS